jgi:hypothetical protein
MKSANAVLGIIDQKFAPKVQENCFRNYLVSVKRPQVKNYITAGGDLAKAQMALAQEFASIGRPDTGRSYYGGTAGNKASVSPGEIAAALNQERSSYQTKIAGGSTPSQAWNALSPGLA